MAGAAAPRLCGLRLAPVVQACTRRFDCICTRTRRAKQYLSVTFLQTWSVSFQNDRMAEVGREMDSELEQVLQAAAGL